MLQALLRKLSLFRYYRRTFGNLESITLANDTSKTLLSLYSRELNRNIFIRPKTTDLQVALKVLSSREYQKPELISPSLIIDAGANIGITSLYFAHRYPSAVVIAIEPEVANYELLLQNCANVPAIKPYRAALWPTKAKLKLSNPAAPSWAFAVEETENEGPIESVTIPQIMKENRFQRVDLLKIDIEGSEKELFSSNVADWLVNVGAITIELHDRFREDCSRTFYKAVATRRFNQDILGENVIVTFLE